MQLRKIPNRLELLNHTKSSNTYAQLRQVAKQVSGVLFLVRFNNFDRTMGLRTLL